LLVVLIAVKVFGTAAVFKHVLDEVVPRVSLIVHEFGIGVLIEEEKEDLNVAKH